MRRGDVTVTGAAVRSPAVSVGVVDRAGIRPDQVSVEVLGMWCRGMRLMTRSVRVVGAGDVLGRQAARVCVITYLTLALCLFADDDHEEIATKVTGVVGTPARSCR